MKRPYCRFGWPAKGGFAHSGQWGNANWQSRDFVKKSLNEGKQDCRDVAGDGINDLVASGSSQCEYRDERVDIAIDG